MSDANAAEAVLARKQWRTLEPYHGIVYFAAEAEERYTAAGLEPGRMGYFASRAAPLGAVPAEVVIATFFNFSPDLVCSVIPRAWTLAAPEQVLEARLAAAGAALARVLGPSEIGSDEMAEAAELARAAADSCTMPGRPLYAGHASLPWPEPPHLVLWHAVSMLREFRGDGHIAAMVAEGVTSGCEALVIHAGTGEVPARMLQASRAWSDDAWATAVSALVDRGWLTPDGALTDGGRAHRQRVEDMTDATSMAPWQAIGSDGCDRLRRLVRPWSKAIVESGTFGLPALAQSS